MKNMQDEIYDVFWEGPYEWSKRKITSKRNHVLYAIFGTHYIYGLKTLLYIGRTGRAGGKRLDEHDWWVDVESDEVFFKLASIGKFKNWEIRKQVWGQPLTMDKTKISRKGDGSIFQREGRKDLWFS